MAIIFLSGTTVDGLSCYGSTTPCCVPYSSSSGGSGGSKDETIYNLCWPTTRNINLVFDCFAAEPNAVEVYANGVVKYGSGCVLGSHSVNVSIPAGTTTLRIVLSPTSVCGGDNANDAWTLVVSCP